jgi:hypothetical protein
MPTIVRSPPRPTPLGNLTNSSKATDEAAVRSPKAASPPRFGGGIPGGNATDVGGDGRVHHERDGQASPREGDPGAPPPLPPPKGAGPPEGGGAVRQEAAAAAPPQPPDGSVNDDATAALASLRASIAASLAEGGTPSDGEGTLLPPAAPGTAAVAGTATEAEGGGVTRGGKAKQPSLQERADRTDWNSGTSIAENFKPYNRTKYGQLRPPKALLAEHGTNLAKAHATCAWRKLGPTQQKLMAAKYKAIHKQQQDAAAALEREEKRRAKEAKKAEKDRQKAAQKEAAKEEKKARTAANKKRRQEAQNEQRKQQRAEAKNVSVCAFALNDSIASYLMDLFLRSA